MNKEDKRILRVRFYFTYAHYIAQLASKIGLSSFYLNSQSLFNRLNDDLLKDENYKILLSDERRYAAAVVAGTKKVLIDILFKLMSLSLLWRVPTFKMIIKTGPLTNPDPLYVKNT